MIVFSNIKADERSPSTKSHYPQHRAKDMTKERTADDVREQLWLGEIDAARVRYEASRSRAAESTVLAGLRPFPSTAMKAMTLLADPEFKPTAVGEAIGKDPALAARLLRVVNSPAYRLATPCVGIEQAIVRIGSRAVRETLGGIAALGVFRDVGGFGERVREHCVGVAAVVRVLASEWRFVDADDIFVAGLMHDVGKLACLQAGVAPYASFPKHAMEGADEVHVHELAALGFDHATLGGIILERWQFPEHVASAVAFHHQPSLAYQRGGALAVSVALLRIADCIEYQLRKATELDEAWLTALAKEGAFSYVDLTPDVLRGMWPKLVAANASLRTALVG